MAILPALRVFLFGGILLFSVVVLAVLFNFEALSATIPHSLIFRVGIASAIATVVVIVATLIVDLIRRGRGVTSMVWFDLVRTFALWALWLATAVSITTIQTVDSCVNTRKPYTKHGQYDNSGTDSSICLLFRISQVSTWIVTFLTFSWFVVLLTTSNIAISRGYENVWTSPLRLHPIGLGKAAAAASTGDLPAFTESNDKFAPSPYGLLVASYQYRASWRAEKDGEGRIPPREGGDYASTSTITVQTVHLDPPPPAVVASNAPAVVDLEAQQPQPRRID